MAGTTKSVTFVVLMSPQTPSSRQPERNKPWFATWFGSPYYPILYHDRNEAEAQAFIDAILAHLKLVEGSRVLDLACGRGRHARYLAQQPLTVWGYDLSAESIAEAREGNPANLHFRVQDMRQPFPDAPFQAVFNLFTSFGYFEDTAENYTVLCNIHHALAPGGMLVLDYLNTDWVLPRLQPRHRIVRDGIRFDITKQVVDGKIMKDIAVFDEEKVLHYQEIVQAISPAMFDEMLARAGFSIVEKWGGYDGSPFDSAASSRHVVFCRKA